MLMAISDKWWIWVIAAIVAVIIIGAILVRVNRHYRINYNLNLLGGGALMCIAVACIGVAIWLFVKKPDSTILSIALIAVSIILMILTIIFDVKRCGGGKGFLAFLLQLIFCIPCLLVAIDYLNPNSSNSSDYAYEDMRVYSERRRRQREQERQNDNSRRR